MRYGFREIDMDGLPDQLPLENDEDGLGVAIRCLDGLVGFRLFPRSIAGSSIKIDDVINSEVLAAGATQRMRAKRASDNARPPSLTVAICSKDRWDWVDRLLGSLESVRDGDPFEVLVIDNAPTDDRMRDVCAKRDGVRYLREPLVGLDFARNRAIREARGEVVAFLDDDVIVDRNWLRAMRRAWAENPDAGCVTGQVLPMAMETEAQILFELRGGFRRGFSPMRFGPVRLGDKYYPCGAGSFGAGANMSVRRQLVLTLGGFDEALDTGRPLPGGGDLDIFYRVIRSGSFLIYEPQAAVYHEHRRDMKVLKRQYYTWGLGFAAFVVKSMAADPAMRPRLRGMMRWWFGYQARRAVNRLLGREPTPLSMIFGEIWGGIVGLCGEYGRSRQRVAVIRAAAPS